MKNILLLTFLIIAPGVSFSQSRFSTNETLGAYTVDNRLIFQRSQSVDNSHVRGGIGQNIRWNNNTGLWEVAFGTTALTDFALINFSNNGTMSFYTGAPNGPGSFSNTDLADYMRLFIHNNGRIGIGTNTPDSKLTVAGNVHAQEVKVSVSAGADFVFEESYNLPQLDLLQDYIEKNKHLPEIPSEKEMKENGLLIGEFQMKLLQKIEELTLYIIDQNKEKEAQNKRIEALEKEVKILSQKIH